MDISLPLNYNQNLQHGLEFGASLPLTFNKSTIAEILKGYRDDIFDQDEKNILEKVLLRFQKHSAKEKSNDNNKNTAAISPTNQQKMLLNLEGMVCKANNDREYWSPRDYKAIDHLGEGAFGKVRMARDNQTGKLFAEKIVLVAKFNTDELILQRKLTRDYHLSWGANTIDSNIAVVILLGAIQIDPEILLFMEYMDNGTLMEFLNAIGKSMLLYQTAWYLRQFLEGLKYIHDRGIIHCDIKGDNVLLGRDYQILKIADFGCAKQLPGTHSEFPRHSKVEFSGTRHYQPPEVIREEVLSLKYDIWCAGCVFFNLIMRQHPFYKITVPQIVYTVGQWTSSSYSEEMRSYLFPSKEILNEISTSTLETIGSYLPLNTDPTDLILEFFSNCFQINYQYRANVDQLLKSKFIQIFFSLFSESEDELSHCDSIEDDLEVTTDSPLNNSLKSLAIEEKSPVGTLVQTCGNYSAINCNTNSTTPIATLPSSSASDTIYNNNNNNINNNNNHSNNDVILNQYKLTQQDTLRYQTNYMQQTTDYRHISTYSYSTNSMISSVDYNRAKPNTLPQIK